MTDPRPSQPDAPPARSLDPEADALALAADEAQRIRRDVESFRARLAPSVTPETLPVILWGGARSDG